MVQDLNEAIYDSDLEDYFLGTIVVIEGGELPSIVDGQQRIATTSILLARIREKLLELGRDKSATAIEQAYLSNIDIHSEENVSRIQMNEENNHFYNSKILPTGVSILDIESEANRATNKRLLTPQS